MTKNLEIISKKDGSTKLTIYDKDLALHTEKIREFQAGAVYSVLGIAYEMNLINAQELYKKAGFKSITEYGFEVFDFKKSTVSLYCKVAETFIDSVDESTKTIVLKEQLPDLTLGQLQELLPLAKQEGVEGVREKFEDSTINQKMSTKDLRKTVRGITDSEEKKEEKAKNVTPYKKAEKTKAPTEKSTPDQIAAYVLANIDAALYALESVDEYVKTQKVIAEIENLRDKYVNN